MLRSTTIAALTAAVLLSLPTAASAGHGKRDHDWFKSFRADWDARRAKWDAGWRASDARWKSDWADRRAKWDAGWRAHDAKWRKDWASWNARWAKRDSGSK